MFGSIMCLAGMLKCFNATCIIQLLHKHYFTLSDFDALKNECDA